MHPGARDKQLQEALRLQQQGRLAAAEALYQKILQTNPAHAEALYLLGVCARQRGRIPAALDFFQRASALKPADAALHVECGMALRQLRRFDEALVRYDRALQYNPDNPQVCYNRGNVLVDMGRHAEALASYERAITLRPDYALAWSNRGNTLTSLHRLDEALQSFARALQLQPDHAAAHAGRAFTLQQLKRFAEAAAGYDRALALQPEAAWLAGNRLHCRMNICDWNGFAGTTHTIAAAIEAGKPAAHPFDMLAVPLSAAQQRRCAEIYVQHALPPGTPATSPAGYTPHPRIRLGYFSADLYSHATAHLMTGLFEQHDRTRFEVHAFSFGPPRHDAVRSRLEAAFEHFHDVGAESEAEIAALSARLGIDIAIDLKGYTQHARPGIFARRAAPVQVNYLGYPGTMAADCIDYLIADPTVIPPEHTVHYSEKIVWLPHCYQVNDDSRAMIKQGPSRQDAGLPEQGFVFCCFNNNWKITPGVFGLWMQLLRAVSGSVLWLLGDSPQAVANLQRAAQAQDVDAGRLVFAPRTSLERHLARHPVADLFLDTLPYNAHTTASDALWAGLPIVTQIGATFASRVAASLLRAVGIPELVTDSDAAYLALAQDLATDAPRLTALREKLAANRLKQPLFDTRLFARHIETGYAAMWQRHLDGLKPDHIAVDAAPGR
jgi:predicted O-linked N-acetylglucosamine transferase (SPINDLY family)